MAASAFIILRCSSFQFYIKPQPCPSRSDRWQRCSSFQFYIKPQLRPVRFPNTYVVPHSNSTSNHNAVAVPIVIPEVVPHSNSTSNHNYHQAGDTEKVVVPHSNSTSNHNGCKVKHTLCIVVPHSNSTSNHNWKYSTTSNTTLFLIPILHQTTTSSRVKYFVSRLFLIPILHQTTTSRMAVIHILHVTHMTPMHKTSCRTPGKLVGCNFVFQRAIYQKNSSC